jgi:phosphatidylglycerol:prolipoprotein diacylglycerol transferase
MHPLLVKIGFINIYSYGTMVALGFAAAVYLIYKNAASFGVDKDRAVDLFILILLSGVLGGRILYIALNLKYYLTNPYEMIDLSKGGLVWYGAFGLGLLTALLYMRKQRMHALSVLDLAAPFIALAQSFGRIGCFLNGCCFGIPARSGGWPAVIFPGSDIPRHPVQLYSSAALLLIFVILRFWQERRHFNGEIFLGYLVLYSLKRFLMEFMRGDNPKVLAALTMSQAISIAIFAVSSVYLIYKAYEWKKIASR